MKRLTILTVLTVLTVSSAGCGRNWDSWLFNNRNEVCQPECEMYYPEDGGMMYEGPIVNSFPSTTTVLPEPASSSSSD